MKTYLMRISISLSLTFFIVSTLHFTQSADAAPRCSDPNYDAWGMVPEDFTLDTVDPGVQVSWPVYPECGQGGINVSGYQLFYRTSAGDDIELYSGGATQFEFSNGNTDSCVLVRAYSGKGGNRTNTNFLEHSNCGSQSGNQAPTAVISGPNQVTLEENPVSLDGFGSTDDGFIANYFWAADPGVDLVGISSAEVMATFTATGTYEITLEVADSEGLTDITSKSITVQDDGPPPPNADAAINGEWSSVIDWPLIAIHTVLLPDGRVLSFGTDDLGTQGAQYFYDVWNPSTNAHQTLPNNTGVDFFCSAPVLMPGSGNVLMPGGDAREGAGFNKGIVNTPVYNTANSLVSYQSSMDMEFARWYPSSIVLSDGSAHVMGGIDLAGNTSVTPEVFDAGTGEWFSLLGASIQSLVDNSSLSYFYPRQWVVPGWGGQLFGYAQDTMFRIDPTYIDENSGEIIGDFEELGSLPNTSWGHYSTAVMYEPFKILQIGGNGRGRDSGLGATILDFTGTTAGTPPAIKNASTMNMTVKRKAWLNSTLLPDGTVFVNGGSGGVNKLVGDLVTPELWDPVSETFGTLAPSQLARLYHSSSLLLPDGRVLVAGGGAPGPLTNLNAEIYSPPYLFEFDNGTSVLKQGSNRISMTTPVSTEYGYGDTLSVEHMGPAVSSASLVKTGAVTHSVNLEQRRIPLDIASDTDGVLSVVLDFDSTFATPGYYMLFLLDGDGTPSNALIIKLG